MEVLKKEISFGKRTLYNSLFWYVHILENFFKEFNILECYESVIVASGTIFQNEIFN